MAFSNINVDYTKKQLFYFLYKAEPDREFRNVSKSQNSFGMIAFFFVSTLCTMPRVHKSMIP
jgi:hypothetical protein